jgi:hypothetical protein
MFSKNKRDLIKAHHHALQSLPDIDSPEFNIDGSTRISLSRELGLEPSSYLLTDDSEFLKYLTERAALIMK